MPLFRPLSLIAVSSLFAWLAPMPSIPAGHDGLCRTEAAAGTEYIVCEIDLERHDLRLMAEDPNGKPYETFDRVAEALGREGKTLRLAMNAGMYHEDRRPVGLAIQDRRQVQAVNTANAPGNFAMKPNGILFVEDGRAKVMETSAYLAERRSPDLATQSGPMLLVDGELHPRFIDGSDSRYVRNGACATDDGRTLALVLSRQPVNFWDFASFFRDRLGCRDALFFDGQVSSLYYRDLGIDHRRDRLGPILAVTER